MKVPAVSLAVACWITASPDCLADTTAPEVPSFSLTPDPVDITTGAQVLSATVQITDAEAGFSFGTLELYHPSGSRVVSHFFFGGSSRTSGDANDGIYQFTLTVPPYSGPGSWTLRLMVRDSAANVRDYGPGQTAFPAPPDGQLTVVNTGPADTQAPQLASHQTSPTVIDSDGGDSDITFTLRCTDALAGFDHGTIRFYDPNGVLNTDILNPFFNIRISGNPLDGIYEVGSSIPQGTMAGTWTVQIEMVDKLGNTAIVPGGSFTVQAGGGGSVYNAFLTLYNLSGPGSLPDQDADDDGLNNATELLLGSDPTDATENGTGLIYLSRDATHLHLNFQTNPALAVAVNGNYLELGGGPEPFRLTGQVQTGLTAAWNEVLPVFQTGNHYRVSLPLAGGGHGFMRLFFEDP